MLTCLCYHPAEKHLALSSAPDTSPVSTPSHPNLGPSEEHLTKLRAFSKKDRKPCAGSGQKTKRCHRDSQSLPTVTHKTSKNESPAQVTELSFQTRESLRWEGVLQDPQEEAKRLELYRTNRRQRYIVQSIKRNPARLETDFS